MKLTITIPKKEFVLKLREILLIQINKFLIFYINVSLGCLFKFDKKVS